ncbi:MAG: F0F1 ATP synthase subunit delta [Oscillospiraceae bacterium]|nr:F0F1 ATP synthase subunit delta [Oscillospiraceae bacterium]
MDKIQERLLSLENTVKQEVQKETDELNKEIDYEIENSLNSIKKEFEKIRNDKFHTNSKILEQDGNKQVFELETSYKTKILNKKNEIVQTIINDVSNKINAFIASPEYEEYLKRNIDSAMNNFKINYKNVTPANASKMGFTVYITQNDKERFYKDINTESLEFQIQINNDIIGGSIVETAEMQIDNSIKSKLEEEKRKLEGLK